MRTIRLTVMSAILIAAGFVVAAPPTTSAQQSVSVNIPPVMFLKATGGVTFTISSQDMAAAVDPTATTSPAPISADSTSGDVEALVNSSAAWSISAYILSSSETYTAPGSTTASTWPTSGAINLSKLTVTQTSTANNVATINTFDLGTLTVGGPGQSVSSSGSGGMTSGWRPLNLQYKYAVTGTETAGDYSLVVVYVITSP